MEQWAQREKDTPGYAEEKEASEQIWLMEEEAANKAAVETMRSFVPVGGSLASLFYVQLHFFYGAISYL